MSTENEPASSDVTPYSFTLRDCPKWWSLSSLMDPSTRGLLEMMWDHILTSRAALSATLVGDMRSSGS
ncbi:hypothetical protein CMUS01_02256 [Colletotrichum musicola]|uniref:Uncharacterized protein n=1 Tax=Colletotrichum musicola TaxID=2175873 RepID=A0A8H6U7A9_9PEZI|nr:hypothetical protein CMUS01_02256 [Colletotrichum musicola]